MFNPVKQTKDNDSSKIIWTTKALSQAISALAQGKRLVANPFYENNTKLLKGDLVFKRTKEEIAEWKHCRDDIIYFANNYCKVMTPTGVQQIVLRDYQQKYLLHLVKNRLVIFFAPRQCGKTVTTAIFLLHYCLFNTDKNALVLGNKRSTSMEILRKIKDIFYEIPYFLKPGVNIWNEARMVFDSHVMIMGEATTINSGISYTFHLVLADEFAKIAPNIQEPFYSHIFPTVTASKARFIISSTQNGPDLFCKLYTAAELGENDYAPFKVNWWEVPEWDPNNECWVKRDEEWFKSQVANMGSIESFNEQFGTDFTAATNSLVSNRAITEKSISSVKFINKDLDGIEHSDCFFWKPDFDIDTLRDSYLIFTTDISEGIGGDYTVQTINKITNVLEENVITETIGYFTTNNLNDKVCCSTLAEFYEKYLTHDKYIISLEYNLYGELWITNFRNIVDNDVYQNFDMDNFIKIFNDSGDKYTLGVRITAKTKRLACKLFKNSFEHGLIINTSSSFLGELRNFSDKLGNGVYAAAFGHDDLIMSQLQLELIRDTIQYKLLIEDYNDKNQTERNSSINFYEELINVTQTLPKYGDFINPFRPF